MNKLYKSVGISKQAFHKMLDKQNRKRSERQQLLVLVHQIRTDHPTMGIRDMYYKIQPETMGRDIFETFCKEEGLTVSRTKNRRKTTNSTGVIRFDNLIADITLNRLNQVWQSDITYYEVNGRFYYITFVLDSFSRRILGYSVSSRLLTEHTTLPSLLMAIKVREKESIPVKDVIFHSDGGGQYYDKNFLKTTNKYKIQNSMCMYAWENGKAERLNGIIKNNYLIHREINTFKELKKEVDRAVKLYNNEKPHIKLNRKTPIEFEKSYICNEQQTDGDKSTTELISQPTKGTPALRAGNNNPPAQISL